EPNTTDVFWNLTAEDYPDSPTVHEALCTPDYSVLIIEGVSIGVCPCGLVGNMVVVWFLGFHMKKSPFTVYVLNLAVADFSLLFFLLCNLSAHIISEVSCHFPFTRSTANYVLMDLFLFSYSASMYLLTAMSMERCLSVL
ncbi:MRGRD protein, partial [Hemiprocne comata]|nr:MRGRD protein [Hemiprocne comata]